MTAIRHRTVWWPAWPRRTRSACEPEPLRRRHESGVLGRSSGLQFLPGELDRRGRHDTCENQIAAIVTGHSDARGGDPDRLPRQSDGQPAAIGGKSGQQRVITDHADGARNAGRPLINQRHSLAREIRPVSPPAVRMRVPIASGLLQRQGCEVAAQHNPLFELARDGSSSRSDSSGWPASTIVSSFSVSVSMFASSRISSSNSCGKLCASSITRAVTLPACRRSINWRSKAESNATLLRATCRPSSKRRGEELQELRPREGRIRHRHNTARARPLVAERRTNQGGLDGTGLADQQGQPAAGGNPVLQVTECLPGACSSRTDTADWCELEWPLAQPEECFHIVRYSSSVHAAAAPATSTVTAVSEAPHTRHRRNFRSRWVAMMGIVARTGSERIATTSSSVRMLESRYSSSPARLNPNASPAREPRKFRQDSSAGRSLRHLGGIEDLELFADLTPFEVRRNLRVFPFRQQRQIAVLQRGVIPCELCQF